MSFPICSLFNENGVSATTQAYTFGFPFSGLFSRKRIFEIVGAAFFTGWMLFLSRWPKVSVSER